jgi:NADH dehydrogenase FAD-containing subunit
MHGGATTPLPRVVIVGAGFGGLQAARSLARAPVRVTVIDRRNYHLFQPLLYQVATAALSPADIAAPIRGVLRRQRNADVLLGEVTGVETQRREVRVRDKRHAKRRHVSPLPNTPRSAQLIASTILPRGCPCRPAS